MGRIKKLLNQELNLKKNIETDKEFLRPNTQVNKLEFVAPELVKEIEQTAIDKWIKNLNLSSLFLPDEEESTIITKILPYVQIIFLILILILCRK